MPDPNNTLGTDSTDNPDKSGGMVGAIWNWPYFSLLFLWISLGLIYCFLVPHHHYETDHHVRALVIAFLCGGAVGMTEISSRYRDEQMKAISSPDGLVYICCNGAISTFALILIFHFQDRVEAFKSFHADSLAAAIAAGFGATAIMRARFAVYKSPDGKDISIGPDLVINLLLAMIDRRIDRRRATRRQEIIADHFGRLKALGNIEEAGRYLLASLMSFQNLSEPERKELSDTIDRNIASKWEENIKLASLGYIFLTITGEENFTSVLDKAKVIRGTPVPAPTPASPANPPAVIPPPAHASPPPPP